MEVKLNKVAGERPFVLAFAFATLAEAMAALKAIDGLPASSAYQPDAKELRDDALARMIEWDERRVRNTVDVPLPMMPDALAADSDEDIGLKAGEAVNGFSGLDPLPDQVTPICGTYVFAPDPFDKPRAIPEVGGFMFHTDAD